MQCHRCSFFCFLQVLNQILKKKNSTHTIKVIASQGYFSVNVTDLLKSCSMDILVEDIEALGMVLLPRTDALHKHRNGRQSCRHVMYEFKHYRYIKLRYDIVF